MSHDNDMRREQKPGIAAYRGNGACILMLCARCKQSRPQLGSKKLPWRGAKRAICKVCVQELGS
jgi:hypothetical protein